MPLKRPRDRLRIFRHPGFVRVAHWVNVVCLAALLMSGLQIYNAHPYLYWGKASHFDTPIFAVTADSEETRGTTSVFGWEFDTTGWLGLTRGTRGELTDRAFPSWITLPAAYDLATGRRWHFFFAWLFVLNGLAYLAIGLARGHFRRDLLPDAPQLRRIGRSVLDHLRLRFPEGEEARHYNVLQKLSYLAVIFLVLPVMALAGLAMSPAIDALFPQLVELFGGRQSARTVHFLLAVTLVLFVIVHLAMVLLSGPWNNIRSMITGRYDIRLTGKIHETKPDT